jgi:hypothetical protein
VSCKTAEQHPHIALPAFRAPMSRADNARQSSKEHGMMFIRTVSPDEAHGRAREMYEEARQRFGYVPNWAQAFSLRPT